ncbi:MAG: multidrug resistance efflux transporter family protein [Eubacteriales bacterium]|nr:multidrug resistance efflux transporter family protein [Eubacteriales bacterium]
MKKALAYGILGSLFFAFTFVFNRSMNLSGGYWLWSACLRYFFTLPLMWLLVKRQRGMAQVMGEIKQNPFCWILWSTVGFGLFYMPLTMASVYGESWFVAATWQITIVAGILLTPLFGKKIPGKNLIWSGVILAGIFLLQAAHLRLMQTQGMLQAFLLILVAAFSYPLGNRKMMSHCPPSMTTVQRVFGMTLCSMPFWILMAVIAGAKSGAPSGGQMLQSFIVALFSGVIATLLFFEATNLTKHNAKQLAVIEATQSGEVIFTLLGGILFLGDALPSAVGFFGILLIVAGMVGNSFASAG